MRLLFIKMIFLGVLLLVTLFPVFNFISKNFSDRFYFKFTYKAPSLIIGSSRALYALNPENINKKNEIVGPLLNFAFTIATSSYGEIYYNAIMNKVKRSEKKGTFILEVNPLTISSKNDSLRELNLILNRMTFFNMDPNLDYILKNNQHPMYLFFLNDNRISDGQVYHVNGWNENLNTVDSVQLASLVQKGVNAYKKNFSAMLLSDYRIGWLKKTIFALESYGKVVLVRLPVSDQMMGLENQYCPQFDSMMLILAAEAKIQYLNFSLIKDCSFQDVHHMSRSSANKLSILLGDTISTLNVTR